MTTKKTTPKRVITPKVVSKSPRLEELTVEDAVKLLDVKGFNRIIRIQRDEKDLRRIINIHVNEAG